MTPTTSPERFARGRGNWIPLLLARAVAEEAASVGVEVRLRDVAELNQELLISAKQYAGRHRSEVEHEPDAPKPSSCSELPDDPASARAIRRSD